MNRVELLIFGIAVGACTTVQDLGSRDGRVFDTAIHINDAVTSDDGLFDSGVFADAERYDSPSDTNVIPGAKRIFLTSGEFSGALTAGSGSDYLPSVDRLCEQSARDGGLAGVWRTYIALRYATPHSESVVAGRFMDAPVYVSLRGAVLFRAGLSGLATGNPVPNWGDLVTDENQTEIGIHTNFWTGLTSTGAVSSDDCNGFTDETFDTWNNGPVSYPLHGMLGDTRGNPWRSAERGDCRATYRLLCVEQ